MKLKNIRLYKTEDVPDHVVAEVEHLVEKISIALADAIEGHHLNIILSAFARYHAGMVCAMIAESDLINAAKTEAIGLIKNIEHMSGQKVMDFDE